MTDTPPLDLNSPYVLTTTDLGRSPGAMAQVTRRVTAPDDFRNAIIGVRPGSELPLDVRLEAVMDGILATVHTTVELVGECSRCLRAIEDTMTVDFAEMFFYPGAKQAAIEEGDEEAEDMSEVIDERIDLAQPVRDAVVTALPFQPLCRPDCQGLCPVCGLLLEDLPADHSHEQLDPRWAALRALSSAGLEDSESDAEDD